MNPRAQGGFTILYPLHAPASIRVHIQFCHLLSISKDVAPVMTFHALYVAVTLIIVCGFTASICLCCTQMFLGRKHSFLVKLRSHWSVHILSVLVKKSATFFIYFFFRQNCVHQLFDSSQSFILLATFATVCCHLTDFYRHAPEMKEDYKHHCNHGSCYLLLKCNTNHKRQLSFTPMWYPKGIHLTCRFVCCLKPLVRKYCPALL